MSASRTIWKFPIDAIAEPIPVPPGARVLTAAFDPAGRPSIWIDLDPDLPFLCKLRYRLVGTGSPDVPGHPYMYLSTFVMGAFVLHVYTAPIPQ